MGVTTVVFDVNETMLDLSGMASAFAEAVGDRGDEVRRLWFARLVHTSTVVSTLGAQHDFGFIGRVVLRDLCERLGLDVDEDVVEGIVGRMRSLPAHPDVPAGLDALAAAGYRLVALTNSGQATAEAQLASAGIADRFESILSVDAVGRFKPDGAVYDHAREVAGVPAAELVMVACHDWDCAGAMRAGWRSVFVRRAGQAYLPLLQPATAEVADFDGLVGAVRGLV